MFYYYCYISVGRSTLAVLICCVHVLSVAVRTNMLVTLKSNIKIRPLITGPRISVITPRIACFFDVYSQIIILTTVGAGIVCRAKIRDFFYVGRGVLRVFTARV